MKRLLHYLHNNQSGSMFIYLFYLATILLLFTTAIINHLVNEQSIATLEIEQLQLNMIHQQTYQSIINDWEEINIAEALNFTFPNGNASVRFKQIEPDYIEMTITAFREPPYQKKKSYPLKIAIDE